MLLFFVGDGPWMWVSVAFCLMSVLSNVDWSTSLSRSRLEFVQDTVHSDRAPTPTPGPTLPRTLPGWSWSTRRLPGRPYRRLPDAQKCIGGVFSVCLAAHGLFFSDSSTKQWRITVGNSGRGFLGSFDDVSSFSPYIDFMILGKCLLERYAGNAGKTSNALRDVFWV